MKINEAIMDGASKLTLSQPALSSSPMLDAECLLANILSLSRAQLKARYPNLLTENEKQRFYTDIERRRLGEPVAYILGTKEFWSQSLKVTPDTLIPRPETECLVEVALKLIPQKQPSIVDLGTGSGAIAIAIASERSDAQIIATDICSDALKIAQENAQSAGLNTIQFLQGNWFEPLAHQTFDMIISNPPYIASDDPHLKDPQIQYEPQSALIAQNHGLSDLYHLIEHAQNYLKPHGFLALEHGYNQSQSVYEAFKKHGYEHISQQTDLSGIIRVTFARKP